MPHDARHLAPGPLTPLESTESPYGPASAAWPAGSAPTSTRRLDADELVTLGERTPRILGPAMLPTGRAAMRLDTGEFIVARGGDLVLISGAEADALSKRIKREARAAARAYGLVAGDGVPARPPRPSEKPGAAEAAEIVARVAGRTPKEPAETDLDLDFSSRRPPTQIGGDEE